MQYLFSESIRQVHASVRELCEFIYRSGNVYSGGTDITGSAMVRGAKIHRDLQSKYKQEYPAYQSEYHIKYMEEVEGYEYHLTGSMDGIVENGDGTIIDEFKTTSQELENVCAYIKKFPTDFAMTVYSDLNAMEDIRLKLMKCPSCQNWLTKNKRYI